MKTNKINLGVVKSACTKQVKDWNSLVAGTVVLVEKTSNGVTDSWYGSILDIKHARNCKILKLKPSNHWANDLPRLPKPELSINNRSHPSIWVVDLKKIVGSGIPVTSARQSRREARRAYVNAVKMFQVERENKASQLELLGLPAEFTQEDLRQKRREMLKIWHPDKCGYYVSSGKMSQQSFEEKSQEITNALSWAATYLSRKGV